MTTLTLFAPLKLPATATPRASFITGERSRRRCVYTGAAIILVEASEARLPVVVAADRWALICDDHNTVVSHRNQAILALSMLTPDWCPECAEILRRRGVLS